MSFPSSSIAGTAFCINGPPHHWYLHQVPDDAGAVRAGCDALLIALLHPDAGHGGLVLLQGGVGAAQSALEHVLVEDGTQPVLL